MERNVMKKKFLNVFLILTISILLIPNLIYAQKPVKLIINGKEIKNSVEPFIENNRTLVPVRVISESLGYNVVWSPETKIISISKDNNELIKNEVSIGLAINKSYLMSFDPEVVTKSSSMLLNGTITHEEAGEMVANSAKKTNIDVAPKIIDNVTFVPIRVIAEQFNLKVQWDDENRTVIIEESANKNTIKN
ncbi:copper amine oxidase N-terminal domain-containing protein [Anaerosphaera multitolerans]|uniref:Copper amine oxidase N-terminal domain-containing protein n=2 Tax=Anaerosphaera multitolerans TaxID=2487351 RepID=A0A437S8H2_9FIRM|nr:copper amine oxidase N-terminal domain-containing protein [Anaerosphaera multitolerans]